MLWIWLILASAFLAAFSRISFKICSKFIPATLVIVFEFFCCFIFSFFWSLKSGFFFGNISLLNFFLPGLIPLGIVFSAAAMERGEVSKVFLVTAATPVLVLFFARAFLKEELFLKSIFGAVLIIAGLLVFGTSNINIRKQVAKRNEDKLFWILVLVATLAFGFGGVGNKFALNKVTIANFSLINAFWGLVFSLGWHFLSQPKKKFFFAKKQKLFLTAHCFSRIGASTFFFIGLALGKASLVFLLNQFSLPIALFLSSFLLGESLDWGKKISAVLILAGAVRIGLD